MTSEKNARDETHELWNSKSEDNPIKKFIAGIDEIVTGIALGTIKQTFMFVGPPPRKRKRAMERAVAKASQRATDRKEVSARPASEDVPAPPATSKGVEVSGPTQVSAAKAVVWGQNLDVELRARLFVDLRASRASGDSFRLISQRLKLTSNLTVTPKELEEIFNEDETSWGDDFRQCVRRQIEMQPALR